MPDNNDNVIKIIFDTVPFENAMKNIDDGINKMTKHMDESSNKNQKSLEKSGNNMKKGFSNIVAFGIAKFEILKGFLKKMFMTMPEVSYGLQIAGDIIMKNLFWPLRKMLIPILQRLLTWVRDNRVMFVKLGTVIANAFKVGISIAKNFFSLIKTFFDAFSRTIGKTFNFDKMIEAMNVALFKIAMIFAFLEVKLKPFTKILEELFGDITNMVGNFAEGFIKGLKGVDSKIDLLGKLAKTLEDIHTLFQKITPLAEKFGEILGKVIGENIASLLVMIDTLITGLDKLIELFSGKLKPEDIWKSTKEWFSKKENLLKALDVTEDILAPEMIVSKSILKSLFPEKKETSVKDAIIKPNGQIIRTDPNDTIMATKKYPLEGIRNGGSSTTKNININIGDINLNVTEGSAKQAGINFGLGLKDQLRNLLLDEALG